MQTSRGVITAVQEGRFRLLCDNGRVMRFMLSRKAATEPQDLPALVSAGARIRVGYVGSNRLIARIAHRIDIEE